MFIYHVCTIHHILDKIYYIACIYIYICVYTTYTYMYTLSLYIYIHIYDTYVYIFRYVYIYIDISIYIYTYISYMPYSDPDGLMCSFGPAHVWVKAHRKAGRFPLTSNALGLQIHTYYLLKGSKVHEPWSKLLM